MTPPPKTTDKTEKAQPQKKKRRPRKLNTRQQKQQQGNTPDNDNNSTSEKVCQQKQAEQQPTKVTPCASASSLLLQANQQRCQYDANGVKQNSKAKNKNGKKKNKKKKHSPSSAQDNNFYHILSVSNKKNSKKSAHPKDDNDDEQPLEEHHNIQPQSLSTVRIPFRETIMAAQAPPAQIPAKRGVVLKWPILNKPVPVDVEMTMIPYLLHWGKDREHGMMRRQPHWRVKVVKRECRRVGMCLPAALSLRRLLIKSHRPRHFSMEQCGLGNADDIKQSATMWEESVQHHLHTVLRISYITEQQQRDDFKRENPNNPTRPTPDFILPRGQEEVVSLRYNGTEHAIHWIEVKMFYGASSLAFNAKSDAVGSILEKAEKYVKLYGTGAFVFSFGCGALMKDELAQRGVLVLDESFVNCERMVNHQKTWCANDRGDVLP